MSMMTEVATIYTEAVDAGHPPTKSVAQHYGITYGAAANRIARARAAGLIQPWAGNDQRYMNPKLIAVAERLGVSPGDLRAALVDLADGDLRVR